MSQNREVYLRNSSDNRFVDGRERLSPLARPLVLARQLLPIPT